ncbi:MAG TPA: SMP-30/gluconolactonase/LRE family protein [Pelagibacterium sp.]|uniref:SMP-30/gluconolactonase/LRE family protein n=1 Tax=Pelagibacterium sp. TaxID=1967288 RepID=UPI002C882A0E|nr:SMP-30/gluconolactonase/LRE family protein [Pelagibacterium sp.]HWJ87086.1 SMP-30/gluconolactonase/LRE family protein [Pelagibacterium sp.]
MTARVFDERLCELGEGPLWHPERGQLFWVDILNGTLLSRDGPDQLAWSFDAMISALGWIDRERLLVVSETALIEFTIDTGERRIVADLDLGYGMRTNDGRADPWGGFWFSSMHKDAEPRAGAIYRLVNGRVERLFTDITIANAICFSPDRQFAYFADTPLGEVRRVALDGTTGMPSGAPEVFLDLSKEGLNPDGAVTDAEGNLWIAQWGASRVAVYDPRGMFLRAIAVDAPNTSCPAFGGPEFSTLFCTSAREGMDADDLAARPRSGMVFAAEGVGRGQAEPAVIL